MAAGWKGAARQDRVGEFETPTDGYGVFDASAGVRWSVGGQLHTLTLRVDNITNEVYRDHLSRIKEIMPQAGRGASLLYRVNFGRGRGLRRGRARGPTAPRSLARAARARTMARDSWRQPVPTESLLARERGRGLAEVADGIARIAAIAVRSAFHHTDIRLPRRLHQVRRGAPRRAVGPQPSHICGRARRDPRRRRLVLSDDPRLTVRLVMARPDPGRGRFTRTHANERPSHLRRPVVATTDAAAPGPRRLEHAGAGRAVSDRGAAWISTHYWSGWPAGISSVMVGRRPRHHELSAGPARGYMIVTVAMLVGGSGRPAAARSRDRTAQRRTGSGVPSATTWW